VLSDTTEAGVWLAEQAAWRASCERLGAFGRVFYRRRAKPEGKKAGNIRDFCLRHGRRYRYFVVLDADSVVTAEALCALLDRMESNPRIGLIQAPPLPVRRATLFARWQQFAARVYGPIWTAGEALLSGPDGNYYGHNAILRAEAFCGHGGLCKLPGEGPLSGLISSHDFVEAALVRRAGYEVWLAPDLAGSYEQCPTTLIDHAIRDRRWCHGNLQHLRVAMLPGLAGWSRMHLLRGAASYLIPPLWLAFAAVVLLVSARNLRFEPAYFPAAGRTLFPLWPVYDFAAAKGLFLLVMGMLFGPRLVAAGWSYAEMLRAGHSSLRRAPEFLASVIAEWVMGALLAPALMVFQAMFVVTSVVGGRAPWTRQRREERRVSLGEALRRHWLHLLIALGLGGASALVSTQTLIWMMPLVLPLLASPALTMVTASPAVGRLADRFGLLQVPEDRSTDETLTVFDMPPAPAVPRAAATLADRRACAWHALTVIGSGLLQRLPDARRAQLRRRLSAGEELDHADSHACLTDVDMLLDAMGRRSGTARPRPAAAPETTSDRAEARASPPAGASAPALTPPPCS
jgi:membrane glycosyltransferase